MPGPHTVTFYTRPGCHLCDEARPLVRRVCQAAGAQLSDVDITGDATLLARFGELIPVVEVDGRVVCQWFIDEGHLATTLR